MPGWCGVGLGTDVLRVIGDLAAEGQHSCMDSVATPDWSCRKRGVNV